MGSNSSCESDSKRQEKMRLNAVRNYNIRIRQYNYVYHGHFKDYVKFCRGQYELECIPEWYCQGSAYTPQYDHRGNQVY